MMNNNINVQTKYFITKNDIYKLCVENDFCTCCNNEQYDELLSSNLLYECNNIDDLKRHLLIVANDIYKYSCDTNIENILCLLFNECVHTIFKINNK